jgi:hypothetical protein
MSAIIRQPTSGDLVGRDFARVRAGTARLSTRRIAWLVGIGFACALALAALRIDILRTRYALGAAIREEKTLVQQLRMETATLEALSHPSRLVEIAEKRGFAPPRRVIDLRRQAPRSEPKASEDQPGGTKLR